MVDGLLLASLGLSMVGLGSCGGAAGPRSATSSRGPSAPAVRKDVAPSNVARADYAGSSACKPCHAELYAAWERSPMHRMTRSLPTAEVRAPFDGAPWRFKDDVVVMERKGDDRFVRVEAAGVVPAKTYKVTRVIGGRTREDYAGLEQGGGRPGLDEVVLPVTYVFGTHALRYKGYSVMIHERDSLRAGPIWSQTCIFCHNTVPEVDRLLGAIAGPHAHGYQGEQVDRWLPEGRRHAVHVRDESAFAGVLGDELARLGGTVGAAGSDAKATAAHAIDVVRAGFDGGALIEEGIGCEACHGGVRGHAEDPKSPGLRPAFGPEAPWLDVTPPVPSRAEAVNRVCARCHQVLFSRYPFTWEGGRREAGAGGSNINSGEARDFLLGGCSRAMACTICHDPHGGSDHARLDALATPSGNTVCTGCHADKSGPEQLRAHARHDPAGPGGSCVACHMPRKNMGLDGRLTRYHRIGSPTDSARVLADRPLECALCHPGWTAGRIVDEMEKGWRVRYPRQRIEELYGSLDANVLRATLDRGKAHEQAVAMAALADAHVSGAAPAVAAQLLNPYPLVRQWAAGALDRLVPGRCAVDLSAADSIIARQAAACGADAASIRLPVAPQAAEDPED
jgi:predicted CXXCH cytochrome family protein